MKIKGHIVLGDRHMVALPISKQGLVVMGVLLTMLVLSVVLSMKMGSARIPWSAVWEVFGNAPLSEDAALVLELRVYRIIGAICAGMLVALSGYALQIVAYNALADPGVLGLSDGGALSVVVLFVLFAPVSLGASTVGSLLGVIGAGGFVVLVARGHLHGGFVLLVGLGAGALWSAFSDVLLSMISAEDMNFLQAFLMGSFLGIDASSAQMLLVWTVLVLVAFIGVGRFINPLALGAKGAQLVGLWAWGYYLVLLVLAIGAIAPVIATVGSIGFVGLVGSFLGKHLVGYKGTELGIVSMLLGALMVLWADTLGRSLFAPIMINAGVLIAVIGAVFFVVVARLGLK